MPGPHQGPFGLEGERRLIVELANDRSLAWGAARVCGSLGASLALTGIHDKTLTYVEPLAEQVRSGLLIKLNLANDRELDASLDQVAKH